MIEYSEIETKTKLIKLKTVISVLILKNIAKLYTIWIHKC